MHTVLALLTFVLTAAIAAACFYGIYRLAKWRGLFSSAPVAPGSGKAPGGGTPAAPK